MLKKKMERIYIFVLGLGPTPEIKKKMETAVLFMVSSLKNYK